jgi:hypothetical protein
MATLAKNRFKKGMPGRPANIASICNLKTKNVSVEIDHRFHIGDVNESV